MTGESDTAQAVYNRICNAEMDRRGVRVSPMTHDEARRRAVEAALKAFRDDQGAFGDGTLECAIGAAIAAYERAMADAGWRWVRDCGEAPDPMNPHDDYQIGYADGFDAARAAMLGEGE